MPVQTSLLQRLLLFVCGLLLAACAPAANPNTPYIPSFFYYSLRPSTLIFEAENAERSFHLSTPSDCALYAIHPAPRGRWIAIEWDCPSGPRVMLFDSANGKTRLAISDPTLDSRLLAWQPDGGSLYLKIGMLSFPQIIRVDAETLRARELPLGAFVYDLTTSPDGGRVLYSLSNGIGFGSETWLGLENAQNASQLLLEPVHITALAQFSLDGSRIAYVKMPDSQTAYPAGELWLMDADGGHASSVATADAGHGFPPAWSPSSDKIAFVGRDDPSDAASVNLSIYTLASGTLTTHSAALVTAPVWSPDGAFLAFTAREGDTIAVWLYEISAQRAEKLATGACCAGWVR